MDSGPTPKINTPSPANRASSDSASGQTKPSTPPGGVDFGQNKQGGREASAEPHQANNLGHELNPSEEHASNLMNSAANAAGRGAQKVKETEQTAKEAVNAAAGNWAEVVKSALKDPKAFIKRWAKVIYTLVGLILFQFMIMLAVVGLLFFAIYKVYLSAKSVWDDPTNISNTLRVSSEMGMWLSKSVPQLAYERKVENAKQNGVAFAADTLNGYDLSALKLSPDEETAFQTWDEAGLAEKFLDDYNAEIKPTKSVKQVDSYDPSAWNLYVNGRLIGSLNSPNAQAFVSVFADDTTHWKEIYTRATLKAAAKKSYSADSFQLKLPDSNRNLAKSQENVTRQLVDTTLKPVEKNSSAYYECLVKGSGACDALGLGSEGSPSNQPKQETKKQGFWARIADIISRRDGAAQRLTTDYQANQKLTEYTQNKAKDIDANAVGQKERSQLIANIRTGASDAMLSSINQDDNDSLLEMYDRFKTSLDNLNYSRVNYDRQSKQSVGMALNYFVAGGQFVNGEMGLLDSWAMTQNLSILEESAAFREAVIGNPIGIFAQSAEEDSANVCQAVYDDAVPVGKTTDNIERKIKQTSCFSDALLPNVTEYKQQKDLSQIYKQLDERNDQSDNNGGSLGGFFGSLFSSKKQERAEGKIRTSPVSVASLDVDENLNPDFDGYTNQVYGVSKTGVEVNGEAYDTMKMAADSLWASAQSDPQLGIGGRYQTEDEVSQNIRYARKFERLRFAYKPASERFLAINSPDSLAGKLALLTPTNSTDGMHKTLALLSPSNLTGAIAARVTPTAYAQATTTGNRFGSISIGYTVSDPTNTQTGAQVYNNNNCASGGPDQQLGQAGNIPFKVAQATNPCKRDSVLFSKAAVCYFNSDDSCSLGDSQSSSGGATPGEIASDTSGTECYPGTNTIGITGPEDGDAVNDDAYSQGSRIKIKLCEVPIIPCGNQECTAYGNGHAVVSSIASEAWFKLATKANGLGIPLSATSSWRSMSHQQQLCNDNALCRSGKYTAVARPGTSNHQAGVAIDVSEAGAGQGASSGRSCQNPQTANTPTYQFLEQYARSFGIKHYANESWHWGTAEKC